MLPTLNIKSLQLTLHHFKKEYRNAQQNYKKHLALEKVMNQQLLHTYFQPIVSLKNGDNIGFEILNRPIQSPIFPSTEYFYDFVGQTEELCEFEHFCRKLSIERYGHYMNQSFDFHRSLVFINIAPRAIIKLFDQTDELIELLHHYDLSPNE